MSIVLSEAIFGLKVMAFTKSVTSFMGRPVVFFSEVERYLYLNDFLNYFGLLDF